MTITTSNPVRSRRHDEGADPRATGPAPRGWAVAGIVAGVAGIVTTTASGLVGAIYDESLFGDPEGVAEAVYDDTVALLVFHTAALVGAVALVVFAAGLHRRLAARTAAGSLLPAVAAAGLLGTAVVSVLGTGLDTEFIFAGSVPDGGVDPHATAMFAHWVNTVPWCWVLAGLSGVVVWQAGRSGAVPRWIGRVGLVLGGLTLLFGVSPLQYMAGAVGPIWLLVTALGLVLGDRAHRTGRA